MAMDGCLHFAVRPLQPSGSGLDGAFRVHLLPEHLQLIGLKVGDICEISGGEDGLTLIGHAIAWRAADKMGANPKQKPAKMTDALRSAFNIKEGSHVNLSATKTRLIHADKVILTDVTPTEFVSGNEANMEDTRWRWRCGYSLINCEAFASGATFEVSGKKGVKKRFVIESVDAEGTHQAAQHLFYCDDRTQVVMTDGPTTPKSSLVASQLDCTVIDAKNRVGGLIEQIEMLNHRILDVLEKSAAATSPHINSGILIHGYEGTGKSLLLHQMEHTGFRKVVKIEAAELEGASSTNKSVIRSKFAEAIKTQPSLVLIDDLDQLAPASGELYGKTLDTCLKDLPDTRVLVVGACRNPFDVYQKLLEPDAFLEDIELPIPDVHARFEILRCLLANEDTHNAAMLQNLSLRTHGFTGRDLARLVNFAQLNALRRRRSARLERAGNATDPDRGQDFPNGTAHNVAVSRIENGERSIQINGKASELAMDDLDTALKRVRPTALREIFFEKPHIQWSDIGGSHAIKERFDRIIGWPLLHASRMELFDVKSEKGVLLYGPPGCSKTLTAQAVAATYDLNFIAVKGAELVSMYVGESERSVREVFRKARAAAPCVIFFDEIDSIAASRENMGTKGLNVLTTLLNEMDGFDSLRGVLVLAATNRPEILDPAIMRPGRFDSHIYLGPPNTDARKEILEIQMRRVPTEGLDLHHWAAVTEGYTGAEIVQMCQAGKKLAMQRSLAEPTEMQHNRWAVRSEDLGEALEHANRGVTQEMLQEYEAFARGRDT